MQLKACVIGLGLLGSEYVALLRGRPEVSVAGVADIRSARAHEVGDPVGAAVYTDTTEMLREQKPDIAVVATPDPFHAAPVLAAIEAGVPTIIQEKPMATTVDDARRMLDAAEKAGARIFINYANRGSAMDRATYYVIQQGLLGDVVYGEAHLDDHIVVPTQLWGDRTREWAAGSSTAHFLLSHVVDFLRWVMAPAEVGEVYAIAQQKVLGYTPDLYDAFLTFDNGAKFRIKAEWIKHIDGLVEFSLAFSGDEGYLSYIKIPGFGEVDGWRANLSEKVSPEALLGHRVRLAAQGIPVRALVHNPEPLPGMGAVSGAKVGLEAFAAPKDGWRVVHGFVDAVLEATLTPASWADYGPLPTGIDGLKQTQVVEAIVRSAAEDRVVDLT